MEYGAHIYFLYNPAVPSFQQSQQLVGYSDLAPSAPKGASRDRARALDSLSFECVVSFLSVTVLANKGGLFSVSRRECDLRTGRVRPHHTTYASITTSGEQQAPFLLLLCIQLKAQGSPSHSRHLHRSAGLYLIWAPGQGGQANGGPMMGVFRADGLTSLATLSNDAGIFTTGRLVGA